MPNDEDWPTTDPHLPSNPPGQARSTVLLERLTSLTEFTLASLQHTMKELLDTHWKDKTVRAYLMFVCWRVGLLHESLLSRKRH